MLTFTTRAPGAKLRQSIVDALMRAARFPAATEFEGESHIRRELARHSLRAERWGSRPLGVEVDRDQYKRLHRRIDVEVYGGTKRIKPQAKWWKSGSPARPKVDLVVFQAGVIIALVEVKVGGGRKTTTNVWQAVDDFATLHLIRKRLRPQPFCAVVVFSKVGNLDKGEIDELREMESHAMGVSAIGTPIGSRGA